MTGGQHSVRGIGTLFILVAGASISFASSAPTKPLAERLGAAETVFVGVVTNRVADGDWVRADLLVETPLRNAEQGRKVAVIWRATVGGRPIYDTAAGSRAIAILGDKHEGRYWLRADKFEDLAKLAEVKRLLAERDDRSRPAAE